jgi:hypothetical protein
MACLFCDKDTHKDQVVNFPVGCKVVAVKDFTTMHDFPIPEGTQGEVLDHCSDGRAYIRFKNEQYASHTFHHIELYVRKAMEHEKN